MGFFKSKTRASSSDAVASTRLAEPPETKAGPPKKLWQTGTLRNKAARTEAAAVRPPPSKNQDAGAPQLSLNLGDSSPALVNLGGDTSTSPWVDLGDDGSNSVKGLLGFSDTKPGRERAANSRLKALLNDETLTVEQVTALVQDCTAVLRQQGATVLGTCRTLPSSRASQVSMFLVSSGHGGWRKTHT
jgi:hypothetical protein